MMLRLALALWLLLPKPASPQEGLGVTRKAPRAAPQRLTPGNPPPPLAAPPQNSSIGGAAAVTRVDSPQPPCASCATAAELEDLKKRFETEEKQLSSLKRLQWVSVLAIVLAMLALGLAGYLVAVTRKRAQNQVEEVLRNAGLL